MQFESKTGFGRFLGTATDVQDGLILHKYTYLCTLYYICLILDIMMSIRRITQVGKAKSKKNKSAKCTQTFKKKNTQTACHAN
jgi:hypothetical protein